MYGKNHLELWRRNSQFVWQAPLLTSGAIYHKEIDIRLVHHEPVGCDTDEKWVAPRPVLAQSDFQFNVSLLEAVRWHHWWLWQSEACRFSRRWKCRWWHSTNVRPLVDAGSLWGPLCYHRVDVNFVHGCLFDLLYHTWCKGEGWCRHLTTRSDNVNT